MFKNVFKYDEMKRAEHMAVRETFGWYYWTHQLLEVSGTDAAAFLDYLYPNSIGTLKVSRARYTTMLNDNGEIIDDVVIFRMEEARFWVSTLYVYQLMDWMEQHKGDFNVTWENITSNWDMYAVQGPESQKIVNALVKEPVDGQKFFQILDNEISGVPVKINRGGFTGEKLGYEIYIAPGQKQMLEEKLRELAEAYHGKEVEEFQIMALTLPTERGFYLMCDIQYANPFEVDLANNINWDKEFIGKAALEKVRQNGPARKLLGYIPDEDDIHIQSKERGGWGDHVLLNNEEDIGRATKTAFSYLKNRSIGYVLVDAKAQVGDRATINDNWVTLTERVFA